MNKKARAPQFFVFFLLAAIFVFSIPAKALYVAIDNIIPDFYDFGNVQLGTESEPATITVTNTSDSVWHIQNVVIRGIHANNFSKVIDECSEISTLNPLESCNIQIVMNPTEVGKVKAALKVITDYEENPILYAHLVGTGRSENEPDISSMPSVKYNFGNVNINVCEDAIPAYPIKTFTFKNDGGMELKIKNVVIHGRNKNDFVILSNNCSGENLSTNETCTVDIGFQPSEEGYKKAALRVISNDPDEIPYRVKLTGFGVISGNPCEQNNPPAINSFNLSSTDIHVGDTVEFNFNVGDMDGDTLICYIDYEGDGTWDGTINNCTMGTFSHIYNIAGTFTVIFKVFDGHTETTTSRTIVVQELNIPTGSVQGIVKDAITLNPIENATVSIKTIDDTLVSSGNTDNTGHYLLENIPIGNYKIIFEKDGYIGAFGYVTINEGVIQTFSEVLLVPNDHSGNGSIQGQIVNAINGSPVPNVEIKVFEGINTVTDSPVVETTADENGNYSINLPAGNYTVKLSLTGFIDSINTVVVIGGESKTYNFAISPYLGEGEMRIVLTWGASPSDLDSHLLKYKNGTLEYHVYYGHRNAPEAFLDRDDTNSYGPETITIANIDPEATYIYKVHNYSAGYSLTDTSLANSGAKVKVYWGDLSYEFEVPNQPGTVWTVFRIENGVLIPCTTNCISNNIQN